MCFYINKKYGCACCAFCETHERYSTKVLPVTRYDTISCKDWLFDTGRRGVQYTCLGLFPEFSRRQVLKEINGFCPTFCFTLYIIRCRRTGSINKNTYGRKEDGTQKKKKPEKSTLGGFRGFIYNTYRYWRVKISKKEKI